MEIYKTICDRCKKELVEKPVRQFTIYNGSVRVDLCEDCYRFFYTWMEKPDDLATVNKVEYELLKEWQRNGHAVKVRSGRYGYKLDLDKKSIEPLTDIEQTIFIAAMFNEEEICEKVCVDDSVDLVTVCRNIERKVKNTLWS